MPTSDHSSQNETQKFRATSTPTSALIYQIDEFKMGRKAILPDPTNWVPRNHKETLYTEWDQYTMMHQV